MASRPVGIVDCVLAAAQGMGNFLALYRTQNAGIHRTVEEILGNSFASGAIAGVASLFLMAVVYSRLAARTGGKGTTRQMVHVLAYGGLPLVASLAIWLVTALLAGQAAFVETPGADLEEFLVLLLHVQFSAYVLLLLWSLVLQLMGFSEVQGFTMRKAFGVWLIGQIIGFLASLLLALAVETLFPGVLLRFIPQR